MRYSVVVEKAGKNFSAYSPDVPGCIATGRTVAETLAEFRDALEFHIEGLLADGDPIPEPTSTVDYVDILVDRLRASA